MNSDILLKSGISYIDAGGFQVPINTSLCA